MNLSNEFQNDSFCCTEEQQEQMDYPSNSSAVGFLKDDSPKRDFVMMTPTAIQTLVDNGVKVYMQHGFSAGSQFSDMDYADVGVEFVDDLFEMSSMVKLLVKFQPISEEQLAFIKDGQTIFSMQEPAQMTMSYVELLTVKRMTALATNLIEDESGHSMLDKILTETLSAVGTGIAISNFLLPYVEELAKSPRLRFALQKMPALMDSVCCYDGEVCNRDIADLLNIPYRNIVTLCWDLN